MSIICFSSYILCQTSHIQQKYISIIKFILLLSNRYQNHLVQFRFIMSSLSWFHFIFLHVRLFRIVIPYFCYNYWFFTARCILTIIFTIAATYPFCFFFLLFYDIIIFQTPLMCCKFSWCSSRNHTFLPFNQTLC